MAEREDLQPSIDEGVRGMEREQQRERGVEAKDDLAVPLL
jgi:hypothetical protein